MFSQYGYSLKNWERKKKNVTKNIESLSRWSNHWPFISSSDWLDFPLLLHQCDHALRVVGPTNSLLPMSKSLFSLSDVVSVLNCLLKSRLARSRLLLVDEFVSVSSIALIFPCNYKHAFKSFNNRLTFFHYKPMS